MGKIGEVDKAKLRQFRESVEALTGVDVREAHPYAWKQLKKAHDIDAFIAAVRGDLELSAENEGYIKQSWVRLFPPDAAANATAASARRFAEGPPRDAVPADFDEAFLDDLANPGIDIAFSMLDATVATAAEGEEDVIQVAVETVLDAIRTSDDQLEADAALGRLQAYDDPRVKAVLTVLAEGDESRPVGARAPFDAGEAAFLEGLTALVMETDSAPGADGQGETPAAMDRLPSAPRSRAAARQRSGGRGRRAAARGRAGARRVRARLGARSVTPGAATLTTPRMPGVAATMATSGTAVFRVMAGR